METGGESLTSKAGILSALSHALDMVEGQPRGHAARTAFIAVRICQELGLPEEAFRETYFASLLKDSGCSTNSARIHKIFGGDDLVAKQDVKFIDWSKPQARAKYAYSHVAPGGKVGEKLRRMMTMLRTPDASMDSLTNARCTRGAAIAHQIGFSEAVSNSIASLDEHWDGKGSPRHLSGLDIPLYARIVGLAQCLELFASAFGKDSGYEMLRERSGRWFDPEIAKVACSFAGDAYFWEVHHRHLLDAGAELPQADALLEVESATVEQICEVFASIVDAKSAFTAEHSTRVAQYASGLAVYFGLSADKCETLRRAALLHDLGKLSVSNQILDKPGRLDEQEMDVIRSHPRGTWEILRLIPGFERIAEIAAAHHEKLNGHGYWRGLTAKDLDLEMRILAVADVFDALSASRPYRGALPIETVFKILEDDAGEGLDADCVSGLKHLHFRESMSAAA